MQPEVTTLLNPKAIDIPEVQQELLVWTSDPAYMAELYNGLSTGRAAIIVGSTDPLGLEGLALVFLPTSFEDFPWVLHFHNRGGRALTKAMIDAVLDFVRVSGYTGFKALNQSGLPDAVWLRIFRNHGAPKHLGSAYFFDLNNYIEEATHERNRKRAVRRKNRQDAKLVEPNAARRKLVKPARASVKPKRSR